MVEARDYLRAQVALKRWVEQHPDDGEAWELLGRAQKGRWLFKDAAGSYERALELGRESAQLLREWIESKGRSTSSIALIFRVKRLKNAALRVIELDPYDVETRYALAAYYYVLPGFLGGDKGKADRLIQELVELSPADGYYLLGRRAQEEDASEETIVGYYQTALRHDPDHALALLDLAKFWSSRDSLELSLEYYRRAVASAPDNPFIYTSLARTYRRVGRYEESAVHFRRALAVDPFHAPARLNLAEYYEKHGTKEAAIREYSLLARNNPTYKQKEVRKRLRRLMK